MAIIRMAAKGLADWHRRDALSNPLFHASPRAVSREHRPPFRSVAPHTYEIADPSPTTQNLISVLVLAFLSVHVNELPHSAKYGDSTTLRLDSPSSSAIVGVTSSADKARVVGA